jgi:hypothetical protein
MLPTTLAVASIPAAIELLVTLRGMLSYGRTLVASYSALEGQLSSFSKSNPSDKKYVRSVVKRLRLAQKFELCHAIAGDMHKKLQDTSAFDCLTPIAEETGTNMPGKSITECTSIAIHPNSFFDEFMPVIFGGHKQYDKQLECNGSNTNTLHVALRHLTSAYVDVQSNLMQINEEFINHSQKWFKSWRQIDVRTKVMELEQNTAALDSSLETVFKVWGLHLSASR